MSLLLSSFVLEAELAELSVVLELLEELLAFVSVFVVSLRVAKKMPAPTMTTISITAVKAFLFMNPSPYALGYAYSVTQIIGLGASSGTIPAWPQFW
jgi:hypothetical protein